MRLAALGGVLEGVDAIEPHAVGARAIGIEIGQRRHLAAGVPFLAARHAGMAADAGVEIDDEAELFCRSRPAGWSLARSRARGGRRRQSELSRAGGQSGRCGECRELRLGKSAIRRACSGAIAHPQVEPGRLPGDGIAVGVARGRRGRAAASSADGVVEQEARAWLPAHRARASRRRAACRSRSRSRPCRGSRHRPARPGP